MGLIRHGIPVFRDLARGPVSVNFGKVINFKWNEFKEGLLKVSIYINSTPILRFLQEVQGLYDFKRKSRLLLRASITLQTHPLIFTIHQLMPYSAFIGLVWNVMRLSAQSDLKFLTDKDDTLFIAAPR